MLKFASRSLTRTFAMVIAVAAAGALQATPAAAAQTCGSTGLAPVAHGEVVQAFGDYDTQGVKSRGVDILTNAQARVSAPAGGVVEYAGTLANMGKVVVINIGQDYRVVLADLSRVTVKAGQRVSAYDAVGAMADTAPGAVLYMELRCGEDPVDPQQRP